MPKRTDLESILIIGAGPIVIGQACEFDYSGTQACKALREEGFRVILVNSNPATIMTDPEFADVTYIEPLTVPILEKIIAKERPSALLPTLGGQTALNLSMDLHKQGILTKYRVEMIGAKPDAIAKGEDRELFKQAMVTIGLDVAKSRTVRTPDEARAAVDEIGAFPLIIRPSFTLGGQGGGIAYNREEFDRIVSNGLDISPVHEVLVEECLLGWKEFEMEVMRDHKDQCVVICSIENFDPMGVHTGDSITVAPAMTLTDKEYQAMRDASFAVIRAIGVETGGSNIQFAVDPETGRMIVIEMNPRVSRSSALASKATGFPIAKIAAKLAVGYSLDELRNDITRLTPASFEPTIDYVVTKVPRFTFEKFPDADPTLTSSMKSVGEAMAIGRTFKESIQKALRSLEIGARGFGGGGRLGGDERPDDATIKTKLGTPNAERIFYIRYAFRAGYTVEQVFDLTRIDPWFLHQLLQIHEMEGALAGKSLAAVDTGLLRRAKEFGFSDAQLAHLLGSDLAAVRADRKGRGIDTTFRLVDTCAAEFEAFTPYYYSSYGDENEVMPSGKRKIMILGGGPNRIGQGIEFDYCCVHASFALREIGFETVMVNSNPETVSTDYDTSDRLYFEPLTLEDVLEVYQQERCEGAIVQFGGQTPLNLAAALKANGVNIIGTSPESIEIAEDRKLFAAVLDKLGLRQPDNRTALSEDEAAAFAQQVGYPVLLRPSFVLGGRGMFIVYSEEALKGVVRAGLRGHAGQARADRQVPRGRDRARRRLPRRRRDERDRRDARAHRVRGRPLGRRGDGDAPAHAGQGDAGPGPHGHARARPGAPRRRAHERPVRDKGQPAVRARGQPARVPHGAVCREGHRGADRKDRGEGDGRQEALRARLHPPAGAEALVRQGGGLPVRAVPRGDDRARARDALDRGGDGARRGPGDRLRQGPGRGEARPADRGQRLPEREGLRQAARRRDRPRPGGHGLHDRTRRAGRRRRSPTAGSPSGASRRSARGGPTRST